MTSNQEVWNQVCYYLDNGISVIPVRDKNEEYKGKIKLAKTAYSDWKEYQSNIISKDFLFNQMDKFNTSAVALICGKVSGNMEAIDIDVKYKPGIDALVIKDIKDIHPKLYSRLRIHGTPSTGLHLIYRVNGVQIPKSTHIAERQKTVEELISDPNNKNFCFIETRGEGGYIVAPPSLGYKILQDVIIPVITFEERESLINICRSYNEVIKEPKIYNPPQGDSFYYDENPYVHFNRTGDPLALMQDLGWKFFKQNNRFIWFTRPGKEDGVSGSFNFEKRIFYNFSVNSGLEERTGYFLSTILIDKKFDGDKKKAHSWLTQNGYGKVNHKIEQKQARIKAAMGQELPSNFSEEARKGYEEFKEHLEKLHPFGVFWEIDEDGEITISREKLYYVCDKLGFRLYDDKLHVIKGKFLYSITEREFFDLVKSYIQVEEPELLEDVNNIYESFIERHGKFTITRLKIIDDSEILLDEKRICYKYYEDCWLTITEDSVIKNGYDTLNKFVFVDKVQKRKFNHGYSGKYIQFLKLACELDNQIEYVQKIMGYYSHEYNDETMGYMVILTEKCPDPKEGGRSGKNIVVKLLSYITSVVDKAGSQAKFDDKLFQIWNGEKVFSISDLPKDFDLSYFKNISTGGFTHWKLFQNHKPIHISKSFKLIFSTNFSYNCSDGGLAARVIPLEFTDFFKKAGGVDKYFKSYFPKDWNEEDWAGFDGFMIDSIQTWIKCGCKLNPTNLSDTGWEKQFSQVYGIHTKGIIDQFWHDWIRMKDVPTDVFKQQYLSYCDENGLLGNHRPSPTKLNAAISDYARHVNVLFDKDIVRQIGFESKKCRVFTVINPQEDPPF